MLVNLCYKNRKVNTFQYKKRFLFTFDNICYRFS